MKTSIGIDLGSRTTKLVCWDSDSKSVIYSDIAESGIEPVKTIDQMLVSVDKEILDNASYCSTGYGRKLVNSSYVSEISCHAKAVRMLIPATKVVVDIGGQDSKVILLNNEGKVIDFMMNDKCAAGTGCFFESIARLCKVPVDEIGDIALQSAKEINISSTCVVFAESEIISLINRKNNISDILMAVHRTVALRIINMMPESLLKNEGTVVLTGGVANNKAMVYALGEALKTEVIVPANPSMTGALGAALFAAKQ